VAAHFIGLKFKSSETVAGVNREGVSFFQATPSPAAILGHWPSDLLTTNFEDLEVAMRTHFVCKRLTNEERTHA
jgi:hypothetical protein